MCSNICFALQKSKDKVLAASSSKSSLLPVPASLLAEENRKGLGVPVLSVGAEQEREGIAQEIASQLPSLADVSAHSHHKLTCTVPMHLICTIKYCILAVH